MEGGWKGGRKASREIGWRGGRRDVWRDLVRVTCGIGPPTKSLRVDGATWGGEVDELTDKSAEE